MASCAGVLMFKTVYRLTLAMFLSAIVVTAQSSPPTTTPVVAPPKTELATISGRVVRSTDGAPLKKAIVVAYGARNGQPFRARPKSATTDADGNFILKDLEAGRYMLSAKHNGYAGQSYGRRTPFGPGTAITLINGQQLKDIMFRMTPAGVIAGRVVDEDGEPMYHAQVEAQVWRFIRGKRQLLPSGSAMTDDLGAYRIGQLEPGRYIVSAVNTDEFQDPGDPTADSHQSYLQTFYPGVYDTAQADSLEVKGGAEIGGINLRLVPAHAVTIRGTVTGSKEGIGVELVPKGDGVRLPSRSTFLDSEGDFEIDGVLPGAYRLIATSYGEKRMFAAQTVEVADSDLEGINLLLKQGADIPGRVRIEGNLDIKDSRIRIGLRPEGSLIMYHGGLGTVQQDMTFTLKGCPDGDYRAIAFGLPEDAYLKAAHIGLADILDQPFHLAGAVRPLEVVISTNGGRVEGSVTDDKGAPSTGARVALVPDEAHRKREELYKSGNIDQYGRFSFRGVTPGAYTIYAWESLDGDSFMDPDFLKAYADDGKTVRVSESSQVTVDLKVTPDQKPEGN